MSGTYLKTLEGHSKQISSIAYSPDGTRIMSGSWDKTLRLWDALSGAHLNTFTGHSDFVLSVAFSSDGTQIMSDSEDKTFRLWNVMTGQWKQYYDLQ